jgi:hypothetical protein
MWIYLTEAGGNFVTFRECFFFLKKYYFRDIFLLFHPFSATTSVSLICDKKIKVKLKKGNKDLPKSYEAPWVKLFYGSPKKIHIFSFISEIYEFKDLNELR